MTVRTRWRIGGARGMGRGAVLAWLLVALLVACEDEQVLTTTRNLDRPGPMAVVCAGRTGDAGVTVGLSPSSCTSDGGAGTLYGFVANTSRGEVAVFRTTTGGYSSAAFSN